MKKISFLSILIVALLATGCKKELVRSTLLAVSEPTSSDGSKTELRGESLVVWQAGDEITVRSLDQEDQVKATFKLSAEEGGGSSKAVSVKAVFETDPQYKEYESTDQFIALFPHSASNDLGKIKNPTVIVDVPSVQQYVGDNTFPRNACPMVAYGGTPDGSLARILFHNLCGVVRVQLCSSEQKGLSNIIFEETTNQRVAGQFEVKDYQSHDPYLVAQSGAATQCTLQFNNNNCTLTTTPKTFYVALPAQIISNNEIVYNLKMTVNTTDGYHMYKTFKVPIRRNALVKMAALNITSWTTEANSGGTANATISGNGTQDRPFLIYTVDDLKKVRDAFNSNNALNGKNLKSEKCYFRIMTSNITLTQENWYSSGSNTRGGMDFNGYLSYYANQNTSDPGIVNNSDVPLFHSISTGSKVEGLTVRGSCTTTNEENLLLSPFCHSNAGNIVDCHVSSSASYVMNYNGTETVGIAGICVNNTGTISGCGCGATLVAPRVAGICFNNSGTIQGCYADSPMKVYTSDYASPYAAGVCYTNSGTVKECYFAANTANTTRTSWGGIVYDNSGNIQHSYVASSGVIQSTTSIGGIVHTMTGGTVDKCWNASDVMNVLGGTHGLGGIVNTLSGGEVRNCMRYHATGSFNCSQGPLGGVVATLSGNATVKNCAFYGDISLSSTNVKGAFVGNMTGGTIDNAYGIQNSAAASTAFYGTKTGGTLTESTCYGQVAQDGVTPVPANDFQSSLNTQANALGSGYCQWDSQTPPELIISNNKK